MISALRLHRPGVRGGMVLFEVVIALGVFATVAFSLVMALDACFSAAKRRAEIDAAVMGLQNQIELIHTGQVSPVDRDQPDDGSGITYHLTIEPQQVFDQKKQLVNGIFLITVTAKWKSGTESNDRSVSQLYYQP